MSDESFIVRLEFDARQPQQAMENLSRAAGQLRTALMGTGTATDAQMKALNNTERGMAKAAGGMGQVEAKSKSLAQSMSTTRYALYDVSNTLGVAGLAMVGLAAATYGVGIAWEANFASVVRTSGIYKDGTAAVEAMRQEFMQLGQELPTATKELAEIGALGGQLGIEAAGIADFTETVAKLTATTDLSAEAAGTALGRFNALFADIDPSKFEALGSAILKVGINSVATETQIVNIGTQISSMGAFAGLTAEQVVGLSGALASVGAQPELSRGTITRTFTLMSRAVAQGGEKLDEFARVSGMSAEQFRNSWGTSGFADTFQSFLKGVSSEGDNAVQALNGLGISSVRDVPLLLRLAAAGDVVKGAFADSASGFQEATELADQYGIIAETTAAKLQILGNNFEILLATLADGGTVFGGLIDGLTGMLKWLTAVANHPIGGFLSQAVILGTALTGVLLLLVSAGARTAASMIAISQAITGMGLSKATFTAVGMTNAITAMGISAGKANIAVRLLSLGLKGLVVGGIVVGVLSLIGAIQSLQEQTSGRDISFSGMAESLGEFNKALTGFKRSGDEYVAQFDKLESRGIDMFVERSKGAFGPLNQEFGKFFNDLGLFTSVAEKDFARLDQAMAAAANGGDLDALNSQLQVLGKETGLSVREMVDTFPRLRDALAATGVSVRETAGGMYQFRDASGAVVEGTKAIADAQEDAAAKAEIFANSIGFETGEALTEFQTSLAGSSKGFFDFGDMIQRVQDKTRAWAEEESKDKYGSKDSWQEWYDGSKVNIQDFMTVLDGQIANQQVWADNMQTLTAAGATAFVTELARMGPEGAPLAAAAVEMSAAELMKLEDQAYLAAFLSSEAFAAGFTDNVPLLMDAYNAGGLEAVQAMIVALRTGTAQVDKVITDYGIVARNKPIDIQVRAQNLDNVRNALHGLMGLVNSLNGRTATITTQIKQTGAAPGAVKAAYASGGYVRGPGTGTSDSISARLSNGEYVIRAAAVRALGKGYLDALNQGRRPQQFASGGYVGRSSGQAAGIGIMELGPKSLQRLSREVTNNIMLDDVAIARAARRGNAQLNKFGSR